MTNQYKPVEHDVMHYIPTIRAPVYSPEKLKTAQAEYDHNVAVGYYSTLFNPDESRYSVFDRELLAAHIPLSSTSIISLKVGALHTTSLLSLLLHLGQSSTPPISIVHI